MDDEYCPECGAGLPRHVPDCSRARPEDRAEPAERAPRTLRFQVYRSGVVRRDWRWRLRAANGRIIAHGGEGYRNKADCLAAVALINTHALGAAVVLT